MGQAGLEGGTLAGKKKIFRLKPLGLLSRAEGLLLEPDSTEATRNDADEQSQRQPGKYPSPTAHSLSLPRHFFSPRGP
jgi:hypothetical protein